MGEEKLSWTKMDDGGPLKAQMLSLGMDKDIVNGMLDAIEKTIKPEHSIIFVATDGDIAIEAIHVPGSSLNGRLQLFPGAGKKTVIAAWSKEYIEEQLSEIDKIPEELRDKVWEEIIQWMVGEVTDEYKRNPLVWEEELS